MGMIWARRRVGRENGLSAKKETKVTEVTEVKTKVTEETATETKRVVKKTKK